MTSTINLRLTARANAAARSAVIPVVQLASAGVTLILWLILGRFGDTPLMVLAVKVFSYSAVAALPTTAGIAYILPNYFRTAHRSTWFGRGEWSGPTALAMAINRGFSGLGTLLAIVGFAVPSLHVIAATAVASAILSGSIVAAQVARLHNSGTAMGIALAPNVFIPLAFLCLEPLHATLSGSVLIFCISGTAFGEIVLLRCRRLCIPFSALRRADISTSLRTSLLLVPHLLFFSALMQGPRLVEALTGSSEDLLAIHKVMLIVTIGMTIVTAFHGYTSVRLQSASDEEHSARLKGFGRSYATIGGAVSLLTAAILLTATRVLHSFPHLTWPGALSVILTIPTLTTYYAISSQLLRDERRAILVVASAATLALFLFICRTTHTISNSFVLYAACLPVMPCLLLGLASRSQNGRRNLVRIASAAALGFSPALIIAALSAVLRTSR